MKSILSFNLKTYPILSLSTPTTNPGLLGKAQDLGHRFLSFCKNDYPSLSGRNIVIEGAITLVSAYVLYKLCALLSSYVLKHELNGFANELKIFIEKLGAAQRISGGIALRDLAINAAELDQALEGLTSVLTQPSVISALGSEYRTELLDTFIPEHKDFARSLREATPDNNVRLRLNAPSYFEQTLQKLKEVEEILRQKANPTPEE
jgi:hypothetical protein